MRRINDELPSDINILRIQKVRHTFHARHSARSRSYVYQVARRRTAFAKPFVWWVKDDLDVATMRAVAKRLVGFHDFRSFSDDDPEQKSTTVSLTSLEIHEDGRHPPLPRRRLSLHLEDGPPARRRHRRSGAWWADGRRGRGDAVVRIGVTRAVDGTSLRPLSGARCAMKATAPESEDPYGLLLAGGVMPLRRK